MSKYSDERLIQIWNKGQIVKGYDSNLYRKDIFGNLMYFHSYGLLTPMGWEVDHSKPLAKDGTYHLNNLQPMHWKANRQKAANY